MLPQLQFTRSGMSPHLVLETAASLIALLAGFLVFGRLRRCGRLNDLLLADALAVLVLLNLCLLVIPGIAQSSVKDLMVWALLIGRSLGAALFALAAFAPQRTLWRPGSALAATVIGVSTAVVLTADVLNGYAEGLAHHLALTLSSDPSEGFAFAQHSTVLAFQLATAAFYGCAAVGFACRSRQVGDHFLGWLAVAGVFGAFGHLNYALYASPYAQMIHTGDIFRLCFYTTLLIGSMREIWSYWHALSEAAVVEERRRIACDLHDGLAQELAYLARNLASEQAPSEETVRLLRTAVARAQIESRQVVNTLAAADGEPVEIALANAAAEVAKRFELGLRLDLAPGVKVSTSREDALVRIACEAVANAGRHSGANEVSLKLERDGPRVRLRVSDRGRGFDPAVTGDGFGLVAMRRRAGAVGGELRISSTLGGGCEVEAAL